MSTSDDKKKDIGVKTAADQRASNEKHSDPEKKYEKPEHKEGSPEAVDVEDRPTPGAPTGTKSNFDDKDEGLLKRAGSQSQGTSEANAHGTKM